MAGKIHNTTFIYIRRFADASRMAIHGTIHQPQSLRPRNNTSSSNAHSSHLLSTTANVPRHQINSKRPPLPSVLSSPSPQPNNRITPCNQAVESKMAPCYEIKATPGKGLGMFATENIEPGTIILHEKPSLIVPNRGMFDTTDEADIATAVETLSPGEQKRFFALHEGTTTPHYSTREARIFHINCFGAPDGKHSYVSFDLCRINHSCERDAAEFDVGDDWTQGGVLRAVKRIEKGREICHDYRPGYTSCLPRAQRQVYLKHAWQFDCECRACEKTGVELELSDHRRRIICALRFRLLHDRVPPSDLFTTTCNATISIAMEDLWQAYVAENLIQSRFLHYHVLLAQCLEAEGLVGEMVARHYFYQAEVYVTLMQERKEGVVPMEWLEETMRWVRVSATCFATLTGGKAELKEFKERRAAWEASAPPELKIAVALQSEGDAALRRTPYTVAELRQLWKKFGTVMPQEQATIKPSMVFAFRFCRIEETGEPCIVAMTKRECGEFLLAQDADEEVKASNGKKAEAFIRRWCAEEGQGIKAFVDPTDCPMS
ncbi:SET domain-containing [Lecanosticta acicola]|uniref:SET domain-containing n=1 Tax=Lecanosticta acicola TaxID=111012 RepID=A0AAI9EAQ7_9PEZI|nr:SET domain-containing [Lecanosticta acicola]